MKKKHLDPSQLQKLIEEKIASVQKTEDDIPAMLIIHDIRNYEVVYMSQRGRDWLNITMEQLREMGTDYHGQFFNPEDAKDYVPKILGLLERNNNGEMISHFQQVRSSPKHDWSWFLSCVKIVLWDEAGNPILTLTSAIPVDAQHHIAAKAQRLLEENNFLRRNKEIFSQLTKTEKEVLRLLYLGMDAKGIAEKLHISENTAATHRRNLKSKLKAKSNFDLIRFAQAFDLS